MNKNEIALSFEQAEYYTLKEACDYLNMKHNVNNITIKKLFQNILKHKTNTYFYAKGFNVTADLMTPMLGKFDNKTKEYITKQIDRTTDILDTVISDGNGLLLLLTDELLERFRFSDIARFYDEEIMFCGVLDFNRLQDSPLYLEFLEAYIDRNVINQVLAIYPNFYKYSDDDWESVFTKSSLKISEYDIYANDNGKEYAHAFCQISINDLLILHKDLIELENNIINNNPAPKMPFEIKPKQGKSIGKQTAQEQAKIIAKALWNTDKEQKIRMKEMTNLVYSELYSNGFIRDLPNDPISLKDWIKEIAPPYATIGGRPKKEP